MAGGSSNILRAVLRELGWSRTRLEAELRRQAASSSETLPGTESPLAMVSRWVNNHQQPSDFYRDLLARTLGRPRAELFSDEGARLELAAEAEPWLLARALEVSSVGQAALEALEEGWGSSRARIRARPHRPCPSGPGTFPGRADVLALRATTDVKGRSLARLDLAQAYVQDRAVEEACAAVADALAIRHENRVGPICDAPARSEPRWNPGATNSRSGSWTSSCVRCFPPDPPGLGRPPAA